MTKAVTPTPPGVHVFATIVSLAVVAFILWGFHSCENASAKSRCATVRWNQTHPNDTQPIYDIPENC